MDSAEGAVQPPAFTFFAAPARAAASTSTLRAPPPPPPSLQRNAQGGVLITEGDVEEALAVLAGPGASGRGATAVPAARLAEALRPFQPSLTKEEVGRLLGGAPSLAAREAQNILVDNGLHYFDPLREAHRALADVLVTGHIYAGLLAGTLVARAGGVEHPPSRGAWHPVGADGKPSA
jgi:hypothetical protein